MEDQTCSGAESLGGPNRCSVVKSIRHPLRHRLRAACRVRQSKYQWVIQTIVAAISLMPLPALSATPHVAAAGQHSVKFRAFRAFLTRLAVAGVVTLGASTASLAQTVR